MATSDRIKLSRQVFRALRHPDFRASMPRARNGSPLPLLIAETTDRLGDLFQQADKIGKTVAIVAPLNRKEFCVLTLSKQRAAAKPGSHPDDCLLHPDSELAMLLIYLRDVSSVARCHVLSPGRKIELLEDRLALA